MASLPPARLLSRCLLLFWPLLLAGCASPFLPREGPSTQAVMRAPSEGSLHGVQVLEITGELARKVQAARPQRLFSALWGQSQKPGFRIGAGDVLEVTVWEAPPASLFASTAIDPRSTSATARASVLPEQMVSAGGEINVPFVGQVRAAGRDLQDIENEIVRRLRGKANGPQVMVRVLRNTTSTVTVVGEVTNSLRMPLTAQGERLLDALAAAGGTRQPLDKIELQLTRGNQVLAMPLDQIVADPRQNIVLQPGDVVTAFHQPFSLTVLGAAGKNEELAFEGQGITLAQALGRAGGVQDWRADATGVFIFRFENPAVVAPQQGAPLDAEGRVPVVYRVDLRDPASFFAAQDFPMRHRDVLYIATARGAELQKFLNIISSIILPTATVRTLGQ